MTPDDQQAALEHYLGPLELRIMEDVWANGPSSVNDVLERLNAGRRRSLVYNTVMATLARLSDKGFLERHRDGRAYIYHGQGAEAFLRDQAASTTRNLVADLGMMGVAGVVDGLDGDPEAMDLLRKLLAEDEGTAKK